MEKLIATYLRYILFFLLLNPSIPNKSIIVHKTFNRMILGVEKIEWPIF